MQLVCTSSPSSLTVLVPGAIVTCLLDSLMTSFGQRRPSRMDWLATWAYSSILVKEQERVRLNKISY